MSDQPEANPELTFEVKPAPQRTHENWVMSKLHDWEMASESRIKGETMGFDTRQWLTKTGRDLFQAALVGQIAANADQHYDTANIILATMGIRYAVKEFFKSPASVLPRSGKGLPTLPPRQIPK